MTQQEFFERTNIELSAAAYAEVERIYMAVGDGVDKDKFCKLYKGLNAQGRELAVLLASSVEATEEKVKKAEAQIMSNDIEKCDTAEFLLAKGRAYNDPDFRRQAVALIGSKEVVVLTAHLGFPLFEEDTKYISEHLN